MKQRNRWINLISRLWITAVVSLLLLLPVNMPASAETQGSITLTTTGGAIPFHVYLVGTLTWQTDQWRLIRGADFENFEISMEMLDDTLVTGASQRQLAFDMQTYINSRQIVPYRQGVCNESGRITFEAVENGLYLIVKAPGGEVDVLVDPFFVTVPVSGDHGGFNYQVVAEPKSEIHKVTIQIRKTSFTTGASLSGAEFQLSYREIGSSDSYENYGGTLITEGAAGSVSMTLPEDYDNYEYRLIETKAPNGYSNSSVGTILFTVTKPGIIDSWERFGGSDGYVEVIKDELIILVKNRTSGGGGDGGGGDPPGPPTPPTNPPTPTGPGGDGSTTVNIDDGSTPLNQLTNFIEDVIIPLSGLVKTGDTGVTAAILTAIMLAGGVGFWAVVMKKRKSASRGDIHEKGST